MKIKNALIKLFLKIVNPKTVMTPTPERILVVSTTGLGDSLWGTPAIKALKKKYPKSSISILTSPVGAQVFSKEECFVVQAPALPSLLKLYRTLKSKRFDTAYIFHTSQRGVLPFVKLLGPGRIIGTLGKNKGFDSLLTEGLEREYEHEITRRLKIVGEMGAPTDMEIEVEEVAPFSDKESVGMHIGAHTPFKQWPIERFMQVGQQLAAEGKQVVLTGVEQERAYMEKAMDEIPNALLFIDSLRRLAGAMRHFSLFITNDTGPMHVAIATKTPTLALFGPTDPHLCGPLNAPHVTVLSAPRSCSFCLNQKCRDPFCMKQITVQNVSKHLFQKK